ncbi:uncharacterized protein [Physcomitrium patens]|uniref:uncharacterized protein isoform X3 n=1 Tax=Physcomitrium patens TaxID=3218 RepID=UPI000D156A04|nr:DNA-binding protein RHL1-like isoform X3 [Physcomitrium patens]|eukprot:XP_024377040.1 DNA-binding protein RHL1-like isoform X3 [Physcomitrella patens]
MGKKKQVEEVSQTKEDKSLEKQSKKLRELARSCGLVSEKKALPAEALRPKWGIVKCDGKDICKKGHRKNKYLFSFPGLVAPVSGGKFGELTQLDSRNPILYIDFPQGRLKLFGTIVYPINKYITMNFVRGAGSILCEDLFESMVVFPEAWWVGKKEENPDELRLDMPLDLQQEKHQVYDFTGGAGEPRDSRKYGDVQPIQSELVQETQLDSSKLSTPKAQVSQRKPSEKIPKHKVVSEWESDDDDDDPGFAIVGAAPTPSRQSARTAGKKYSYAESSSEENLSDDADESDDLDGKQGESRSKAANKAIEFEDADDTLLVPESQASKKDVTVDKNPSTNMTITIDEHDDEEASAIDHLAMSQTRAPSTAGDMLLSTSVQAVANASTTGAGSRQSTLSTFFLKSSEKEKVKNVEPQNSVVDIGFTRTYQREKLTKLQSTFDKGRAAEDDENVASKTEVESVLPFTPPESNGSKRKRKAPSERKQISKGVEGKGKTPVKRRKKIAEDKEPRAKDQLILVSDDSDSS